ncbi:hypothetical protein USB125703_00487 [Pseudoclavibacter triregionum]|nr:hypothetical protein USB125703_00487 [Pseudoclavibacter triregionum]
MRSSRSRRLALVVLGPVALAPALALAGCAPSPSIEPPIRWSAGPQLVYGDDAVPAEVAAIGDVSIELDEGGVGAVSGAPLGDLAARPDGTICVEPAADGAFTGEIAWRVRSERSIEVAGAGGSMLLTSAPGRFDPDWSEVRIFPCGVERAYWRIGIACGSLGATLDERLGIRPCAD